MAAIRITRLMIILAGCYLSMRLEELARATLRA
jgi:hypothetical protein